MCFWHIIGMENSIMKRLLLVFILAISVLTLKAQDVITGRIVDEQSQPMGFVNVLLLNRADSAFIQGAVTKNDGTFSIPNSHKNGLLKVTSVGYVTRYVDIQQSNIGNIKLLPDTKNLNEVVVKGHVPPYKMTAEGLQTNVENTVLSKLGTGEDVLAHVPGIVKKKDNFEVFGKGTPLIYINGRQMRDNTELDQLKSDEIKSIEVITNPGAKYNASVKAVIKIRTKAAQGEGLGFDARSTYYQSENTDLVNQFNWNYRHNRFDVFGSFEYVLDNGHYPSTITTLVKADTLWNQKFDQDYKPKKQTFYNILGTSYQFNDSNSVGFRFTLSFRPNSPTNTILNSDVTANGSYYDYIANTVHADVDYRPEKLLNIYYKGKIGKAQIDFNSDYLYRRNSDHAIYNERSESRDSRIVNSQNTERNELFASKLIVDYPLFGGDISVGAEYSHTKRNDDYVNPEHYVPTSFALLKETNVSPFMEYSRQISRFHLTAGLRYEWVDFDYYEDGKHIDEQSRTFGNIFPSFSVGTEIGKVQMNLAYTAQTHRPTYQQLSNNVTYANRFLLQSGNPLLKHEYIHDVSLSGVWKFMQFSVGYNDRRHAIIYWTEQQADNSSVSRITFKNIPTLKSMSAQIAVAPNIGIWSPELTAGMKKQWLTLHTDAGTYRMNDPIFQSSLNNAFDFGHGWMASVDGNLMTKGNDENGKLTRNIGTIDISLTKSLLKNRLSIRLQGTDIFHSDKQGILMYAGLMESYQKSWYDSRQFVLTIRYKFNTTRSKYKGTGAGNEEKSRM